MAVKYARAAGGNWNVDATWSLSSGGPADTTAPTAADDVRLDAASGNVTITAAAACRSLDCNGYPAGRTLTHNAGVTLSIGDATAGAGSIALRFSAAMTYTRGSTTTSTLAFVSTNATQQTIDFAGKTVSRVDFNGVGGSWILSAAMTCSGIVQVLGGAVDLNGQTCSSLSFSMTGNNVRSLTMGASTWTLTATGGAMWSVSGTNMTIDAGTSSIVLAATSSNPSFNGGGLIYYNVTFQNLLGNMNAATINGANTFNNLTVTGTAVKTVGLQFVADQIINGTFTVTGNSAVNRIAVYSSVLGTQRTITAAATALTNCDFADIAGAGAAAWTGTSFGDIANNSGITFTAPVTRYKVGGAGSWSSPTMWSVASGGASGASVPLPQDTAVFDANSGAGTFTIDVPSLPSLDFTNAATVTVTFTDTSVYMYRLTGDLVVPSAIIATSISNCTMIFRGAAARLRFGEGRTTIAPVVVAPGGTLTFEGHVVNNGGGGVKTEGGTIDLAGFDLSVLSGSLTVTTPAGGTLVSNGGQVYVGTSAVSLSAGCSIVMGAGSLVLFGNTAITLNGLLSFTTGSLSANGNITVTAGGVLTFGSGNFALARSSSNVTLSVTATGALNMGTATLYVGQLGGQRGAQVSLSVQDGQVFNGIYVAGDYTQLSIAASVQCDFLRSQLAVGPGLRVTSGKTLTVMTAEVLRGTGGRTARIFAGTAGTPFTLTSPETIVTDWVTMTDCAGAGAGAPHFAGGNSVDVSGNSGWSFTAHRESPDPARTVASARALAPARAPAGARIPV